MLTLVDSNKKEPRGMQFRRLWTKLWTSRPLPFILVSVIALARMTQIPYVQEPALWALACVVLSHLGLIVNHIVQNKRGHRFKNISAAQPVILDLIKECNKRDGYVEVLWLGMTMYNAWSSLVHVLNELRDESSVNALRLRVAMLDPAWLIENHINPSWTPDRARATEADMVAYFEAARTIKPEWTFDLTKYSHMPCKHGGLINGKYLLTGECQWKAHDKLEAGECTYHLYSFKDLEDLEEFEVFRGWFEYCAKPKTAPRIRAQSGEQKEPTKRLGSPRLAEAH
jgi:hypothetical protein